MDALDLCSLAWGERKGYVSVALRDPTLAKEDDGYWVNRIFKWPADRPKLEMLFTDAHESTHDVYWAPAVFRKPVRRREHALPTRSLWADLDTIDPAKLPRDLKPSAAWQSSPGRWQALWLMDKELSTEAHENLNQRLTYAIGADKGGWDTAQVLRTPGTPNLKYPEKPEVELLWLKPNRVLRSYTLDQDLPEVIGNGNGSAPSLPDGQQVVNDNNNRMNARTKELIKARYAKQGTRSERLWELECLLAEQGFKAEQIAAICKRTVWNKFKGRRDEVQRLLTEAAKAIAHAGVLEVTDEPDTLELATIDTLPVSWREFDRVHIPIRWLIADVWGEGEVGFISGLPKSYKSWVALDLAVSVATGTRFLGSFATHHKNVLLIQEEDPRAVLQDRLAKIAASKGLIEVGVDDDSKSVEIHYEIPDNLRILSNQGFTINEDWLEALEAWINDGNIELCVIDPLMMVAGGSADEFKAFEFMDQVLKPLKRLSRATKCALTIVHHHTKAGGEGGAKSMYGTVALWAWEEAALHLQLESPGRVIAERFSKHSLLAPLGIEIGDVSDVWDPSVVAGEATRSALLDVMTSMGVGLTMPELEGYTGLGADVLRAQLGQLVRAGKVKAYSSGEGRAWRISLDKS